MEEQVTRLICDPCKKAGRRRLAIEKVRVALITSGKMMEIDVCRVHLNPYTRNGYRPRQQSAGRPKRGVKGSVKTKWAHLPRREPGDNEVTSIQARKILGLEDRANLQRYLKPIATDASKRGFALVYRRADVEAAREKKKAGTTKRRARKKAA